MIEKQHIGCALFISLCCSVHKSLFIVFSCNFFHISRRIIENEANLLLPLVVKRLKGFRLSAPEDQGSFPDPWDDHVLS